MGLRRVALCVQRVLAHHENPFRPEMMMRSLVLPALPVAALASLLAVACGGSATGSQDFDLVQSDMPRDTAPQVTSQDAAQLATDDASFATDLYKGVVQDETSNVFYSPYSVSLALAMTYAGAHGKTADQIAQAMHFTLPADRLHAAFDAVDLALASRAHGQAGDGDKAFHLDVADSLWGDRSITFQNPFLDTLAVDYGAGVRVTDFQATPDKSRQAINGWVNDATSQKIPELLPSGTITADTRFVLVNAIYFSAGWSTPFDAQSTHPATFTRGDGTTVQADEMGEYLEGNYAEGTDYQAVEIPYAGNETSMVVILPKDGQMQKVEGELSGDFLMSVFGGLQTAGVNLSLPKFQVHGPTISLRKQLIALGMVDAFDAGKADFTSMLSSDQGNFWLGDVLHQAFVSVDEKGTEAAAATAVIGLGTAAPAKEVTVDVNRPFLFAIRDIPTNTVLFVGRVMDPTAK